MAAPVVSGTTPSTGTVSTPVTALLNPGKAPNDPAFFSDGSMSFLHGDATFAVSANLEFTQIEGGQEKKLDSVSDDVRGAYRKAMTQAPAEYLAIVGKGGARGTQAPAAGTPAVAPKDTVESASTPARGVAEFEATRQRERERDKEVADLRAVVNGRRVEEGKKLEKPGIGRAILEILEYVLRAVFPVFNIISAIVRLTRILTHMGDADFNMKQELLRLGFDIVGAVPFFGAVGAGIGGIGGIGAAAMKAGWSWMSLVGAGGNAAANLLMDKDSLKTHGLDLEGVKGGQSQLLGGINELGSFNGLNVLDDHGVQVRNPIRESADWALNTDLVKAGRKAVGYAADAVTDGAKAVRGAVSGAAKSAGHFFADGPRDKAEVIKDVAAPALVIHAPDVEIP